MELRKCKPNKNYVNKDSAYRVWLNESEQEQLMNETEKRERISVGLMLHSGLRSAEVPHVRPTDIEATETDSGTNLAVLQVRKGKDTRGYGGSNRKTIIPSSYYGSVKFYCDMVEVEDNEPIIPRTPRTVKRDVKKVVERLEQSTGNSDWNKVSAHDLRRSWGHRLLIQKNMNPHKLMALGGWNDLDTMMRYISIPTEEQLIEEWDRVMG